MVSVDIVPCSLRSRQESWQKRLDSLPTLEVIVTNCILAAAATTYCGPLKTHLRQRLFDTLLHVCCSHGLPPSGAANTLKNVLKLQSYPAFMLGEVCDHCCTIFGYVYVRMDFYASDCSPPLEHGGTPTGCNEPAERLHSLHTCPHQSVATHYRQAGFCGRLVGREGEESCLNQVQSMCKLRVVVGAGSSNIPLRYRYITEAMS